MAKAAAAAMAYANLVATGTFIKRGNRQPGFTIAAEAGVGLKAGAGFRVIARLGVDDPRRLVRRTIDVAVDETLTALHALVPAEARPIVREASAPLKIGLRSAFELGAALAENSGAFSAADGGKLALRLVQVGLEEMQRLVLERAVEFASRQVVDALRAVNFNNATWVAALTQRQALANRLRALPEEPFEATDANRTYWRDVVLDAIALLASLSRSGSVAPEIAEALSTIWAGAQLLMKSVERISVAQARVSVIGAPPVGTTAAFNGDLPAAPPVVVSHINSIVGRAANAPVRQQDAVAYLVRVVGDRLAEVAPEAATVIPMLTGSGTALPAALSVVLSNLGAFVPGPNGQASAEASLAVLRGGLRTFIATRIDEELLPHVQAATADAPEIRTYLDEVLLSTLRTVVDAVFDTVLAWQTSGGDTQRALRELCSGLLMRLFGRSVVVTADVLLAHALGKVQSELRQLADKVNDAGGVVPTLASITGLDRELLADLVEETLEVCAETFGPMPPERRARVRDLMYQMIDTVPPGADASMIESLKAAGMVGNAEAALELTQLLGEEIAGNLLRFVEALLTRIAAALLELLVDAIRDIQRAVEEWLRDLEELAQELLGQLADLLREIGELQQSLDNAVDDLLGHASRLLGGFAEHGGSRSSLRGKLKDAVAERALDALADFPGYGALPSDVRRGIRRTVRNIVDNALNDDIFDPVLDVLAAVSAETAGFLDDLREIEPGDDLAVAIADIALDRIEDGIRDAFDGNPSVRVRFDAPIIGEVNLGRISVPMNAFISVARGAVRALSRFNTAVADTVEAFTSMLDLEEALQGAEREHAAASATKREADDRIAEARDGGLDLQIASPRPASATSGPVTLRLRIPGGTAALLSSEGLSQRRLFVWVNGSELALDAARVAVEFPRLPGDLSNLGTPGSPQPSPGSASGRPAAVGVSTGNVTGLRPAGAGLRNGHPLVAARAKRKDQQRAERMPLRAAGGSGRRPGGAKSPPSAGAITRFAGATLPATPAAGKLPPRVVKPIDEDDDRPVLSVEIDVPGSLLHEGINAIACALVPGGAARRIERSVSFLHVPAPKVSGGTKLMPPSVTHAPMPAALSGLLSKQGLLAERPKGKTPSKQVRRNTWVQPLKERQKAVEASRKKMNEELQSAAGRRKALREAVKARVLRPKRLARINESENREQP
jgi:hypothetical protein